MMFTPAAGRQQATLDLHGVIFGDNGAVVQQLTRTATISLSQSDYELALKYGMQLTFDMPVKRPGAYQVRIAARDKSSSRIGSAGQFVAVPDLKNNKMFATSGVVLGVGVDGAKHELYNAGARRFAPNSDLCFAFMVYNATNQTGASRNLVMQTKLFRDGKSVYSGPEEPVKLATTPGDLSRGFASGVVRLAPDLASYFSVRAAALVRAAVLAGDPPRVQPLPWTKCQDPPEIQAWVPYRAAAQSFPHLRLTYRLTCQDVAVRLRVSGRMPVPRFDGSAVAASS